MVDKGGLEADRAGSEPQRHPPNHSVWPWTSSLSLFNVVWIRVLQGHPQAPPESSLGALLPECSSARGSLLPWLSASPRSISRKPPCLTEQCK